MVSNARFLSRHKPQATGESVPRDSLHVNQGKSNQLQGAASKLINEAISKKDISVRSDAINHVTRYSNHDSASIKTLDLIVSENKLDHV